MLAHESIYGAAELYDLAFSYRDFAREAAFLRRTYERARGRAPNSFLELAAGPARHALAMQAAGLDVCALDAAPEMARYAAHVARRQGHGLPYLTADMAHFTAPRGFDLAACMLCSATYLTADDAFAGHLRCVREALNEGGLYVLELPHPGELERPKTQSAWTMRDERGELDVEWSEQPGERIGSVWTALARLCYRPFDGSPPIEVNDRARQRDFTLAQIEHFAQAAELRVTEAFGALDESVSLDAPSAWRMLAVLERR